MSPYVSIEAPARLHLGFLDMEGGLGRRFGGLGVAIEGLSTVLRIQRADASDVEGVETERARTLLERAEARFSPGLSHHLVVEDAIPAHCGLGSGTQLAIAIACALRTLEGVEGDAASDAAAMGRGARSGLGSGLFETGGFVVDGGRGKLGLTPPVVARLAFPAAWRIVLVADPTTEGLHGADEKEAFAALPPFPAQSAGELCRRVLMQALPALVEQDLVAFGAAITHIQSVVGDHFAPAQSGGRFVSARVGATVERLLREGGVGGGQTSWGPTGFVFADCELSAHRLVDKARRHSDASGLTISVVAGRNRGAVVRPVFAKLA